MSARATAGGGRRAARTEGERNRSWRGARARESGESVIEVAAARSRCRARLDRRRDARERSGGAAGRRAATARRARAAAK